MLAPEHGELEGGLGDAGRGLPGDLAHGERKIRRRHEFAGAEKHVAVGVEAFGVFAHDDEVDRLATTRRKTLTRARRADIGVKFENFAQLAGRIAAALRERRIFVVRDRPEHHAVGSLGSIDHRLRQGRALGAQRGQADRRHFEDEPQTEFSVGRAQHGERCRHDLRPDAVAIQNQQIDDVIYTLIVHDRLPLTTLLLSHRRSLFCLLSGGPLCQTVARRPRPEGQNHDANPLAAADLHARAEQADIAIAAGRLRRACARDGTGEPLCLRRRQPKQIRRAEGKTVRAARVSRH